MVLFELYLRLLGYNISKSSKMLAKIKEFDFEQFKDWQTKKKWDIAKYHYKNNSFYRNKVGRFFPEKWSDLPIIKKADLQGELKHKISDNYSLKNLYVSNTSGSSGNPFFFAKNKSAHAMDYALIKDRYDLYNLKFNAKQARFFGIPLDGIGYYKEKIKDIIMNRVRFPVFDLSDDVLKNFYKKFLHIKFVYIYGYTNSLLIFAKFLIKKEIVLKDICPTLRCCIVTSELLVEDDEKILNKAFGVKIINEYGASEVGVIAFMSPDNKFIVSDEILFCEIKKM